MSETIKKISLAILGLYITFGIALLFWVVVYSGSTDGDTLEHVHSSWLVYNHKLPYKDFFQHHNPLLWYVGAPLVGMFAYSLKAIDAVNMLTICFAIIMFIYIYKIHKDFLSDKLGGLIAISFCLYAHESLFIKDFKPDNYMTTCLVVGIYYLFCYIRDKKIKDLVISFLLLFLSFMFTQKAVLILLCLGLVGIYLVYKKHLVLSDVLVSAILPIMIYITYLSFLWYEDVLIMYIKANFELNSHIPAVFYTRRFIYPSWEMIFPLLLSFYALFNYCYRGNIYTKITCFMFISEYAIRLYYFTPFVYYYSFLHVIASILAGITASEFSKKYKYFIWVILCYFIAVGTFYTHMYSRRIPINDSYKYGASGFVLMHTNPCDYVLNGYRIGYNLFNKDISFIWNLLGQIDVIAATIGIKPLDDLEGLIRKYRPKIIHGKTYYDTYREYRGAIQTYPIHPISKKLLSDMYVPMHRDDLYILKPEYQSYNCQYSPRTKTYEYRDNN